MMSVLCQGSHDRTGKYRQQSFLFPLLMCGHSQIASYWEEGAHQICWLLDLGDLSVQKCLLLIVFSYSVLTILIEEGFLNLNFSHK